MKACEWVLPVGGGIIREGLEVVEPPNHLVHHRVHIAAGSLDVHPSIELGMTHKRLDLQLVQPVPYHTERISDIIACACIPALSRLDLYIMACMTLYRRG